MAKVRNVRQQDHVVELNGKKRKLVYDLNAFAAMEEKYGSMQKAFEALGSGSIRDTRFVLWAGLIHEEVILDQFGEPDGYAITPYQVGGWVKTPAQMGEINKKIAEAVFSGMPDAENLVGADATTPAPEAPASQGATVVLTAEQAREEQELKNS